MKIYGAGLAGLLAGCHFQRATILEAGPENSTNHKALLRFRSNAVGDSVGIDFKQVRVHKGIWFEGEFVEPNIKIANMYSQKVIGRLADRSIWNLDPVDRYIAPEDFIEQLIDRCSGRIVWNNPISAIDIETESKSIISTIPLSSMLKIRNEFNPTDPIVNCPKFNYAPITVRRWRVKNAGVYQTIYFPDPASKLYRASITGDMLIAEYVGDADALAPVSPFGLHNGDVDPIETSTQHFGKIAPIDDAWRKQLIYSLSLNYNIFSLGRFATWRNILLDDVLNDITVIKKLMSATGYERSKINSK